LHPVAHTFGLNVIEEHERIYDCAQDIEDCGEIAKQQFFVGVHTIKTHWERAQSNPTYRCSVADIKSAEKYAYGQSESSQCRTSGAWNQLGVCREPLPEDLADLDSTVSTFCNQTDAWQAQWLVNT